MPSSFSFEICGRNKFLKGKTRLENIPIPRRKDRYFRILFYYFYFVCIRYTLVTISFAFTHLEKEQAWIPPEGNNVFLLRICETISSYRLKCDVRETRTEKRVKFTLKNEKISEGVIRLPRKITFLETRVHVRWFLCLKSERTNRNRGTPRFLDNKKIWVEKGRKERNARGRVSNNVSNTDEIVKVRSIFTSKAVSCLFLFCKTANENLKFRNISNTTFLHMSIIYNLSLRGKIFANYKRFVVTKVWTLLKAFNFSKGATNLFV